MSDEPLYHSQDLDHANVAGLTRNMAATLSPLDYNDTALYGIVSERDGGIIAYAIGTEHADYIVAALEAAARL